MKIEIEVTEKQVWAISDELDATAGLLHFFTPCGRVYIYRGEWTSELPQIPELRKAVEAQWNKLKPLADDEILIDGRRYKMVVSVRSGMASVEVLDYYRAGGSLRLNPFVENRFIPLTSRDEVAKRAKSFWIKNYPWAEDEYVSPTGEIKGGE